MQLFTLIVTSIATLATATPLSTSQGPSVHQLSESQCEKKNFPHFDHETVGQNLILRNAAAHTVWVGGQMHIKGSHQHFPADNSKIKLEPHSCTLVQNLPTQNETGPRVWTIYGCDEKGENCVAPTDD